MNDNTKTISFVAAAAAIVLLAFVSTPARVTTPVQQRVGESLFPDLEKVGALDVKGLEIVQIQEDTGKPRTLKVKQVNGRWVLPDHQNYPADAVKHLAAAVKDVRGLQIADVAGDAKGDHEQFGVIEPKLGEQKGATGVGTLVTVLGDKDQTLARLIVGKPFGKDAKAGNLRYARVAGQDEVYLVDVKTDNWSTKFEDWIESKLLNLQPWDIKQLEIRDYSAEPVVTPDRRFGTRKTERSDIVLDFDGEKSTWNVAGMQEFDGKHNATEVKLTDDEQLNSTKINEVKTALDELKIIDAETKPAEMTSDLIAFFQAAEDKGFESLVERGFFPHQTKDGDLQLDAAEGELVCRMKDGVEYVLRFGEIAGATDAAKRKEGKEEDKAADKDKDKKDAKSADAKAEGDKKPGSQVSRFVWVMAQVNDALIPKPMLEPLPEDAKPEEKKPDEKGDAKKPDEKPDPKKADAKKSADGKADEKKTDAAKDAADPASAKTDDDKKTDAKKTDEKKDDTKKDDAKKDDAKAAERQRIEAENKRKQADYDEKLKKAQDRVTELNKRFGNWYYVVADDEYKKIHLSRADVIQKKEKPKGLGDNIDDFNELQKGLKGVPPSPTPEK